MIDKKFYDFLSTEGYFEMREIEGRGVCALGRMMFTVGLFCAMDYGGYGYRYCYGDLRAALDAIRKWDGVNHPPGPWIKRKGEDGELWNEGYNENRDIV